MNDNLDEYFIMLNNFRIQELSHLLGAFGQNSTGRKPELIDRALELLWSKSSESFHHESYLLMISELFLSMKHELYINIQIQQEKMAKDNTQIPTQRMYHGPQYAQSLQIKTQPGLPPAMPRMQGSMYGNSVGANTIQGNSLANNNIQYSSRNSQMARPHTVASQLPSGQTMNVGKAQQGFDMNATSSDKSYMPSDKTLSNINFKKLTFYDVYETLIQLTILNNKEKSTLPNAPQGMREATFKLNLTSEQCTVIGMNRNIIKNEYIYQYQIRICQLEPGCKEVTDFLPLGLRVIINDKDTPLPPYPPKTPQGAIARRASWPINCTKVMRNAPVVLNEFAFNWIPDQKTYAMGVYLVKKLSTEILIQKLLDKGSTSSDKTKNEIIKKLAQLDPDVAAASYNFSLVCPLGKIRMQIPARSIHCDHLQCFDASTFLLMNDKKPTWMCPTCNQPCLYDDIVIQNYFLEVVTSPTLTDDIREIVFLADGTWVVYDENNDTNQITNGKSKLKIIESVNLDSDDEESVEPKKDPKPECSKSQGTENLKSAFNDLAIYNNDLLRLKKIKQDNEALAADNIQVSSVELNPQAQVQQQFSVTSSGQGEVIEVDSPSSPTSPTHTSEAS